MKALIRIGLTISMTFTSVAQASFGNETKERQGQSATMELARTAFFDVAPQIKTALGPTKRATMTELNSIYRSLVSSGKSKPTVAEVMGTFAKRNPNDLQADAVVPIIGCIIGAAVVTELTMGAYKAVNLYYQLRLRALKDYHAGLNGNCNDKSASILEGSHLHSASAGATNYR